MTTFDSSPTSTPENGEAPERLPRAKQLFSINRLAVLSSGSGSTFEAIAQAVQTGEITADYFVLVTDKPQAGALERAPRLGVETAIVDWKSFTTPSEYDHALAKTLIEKQVGLVFLAGYLRRIGSAVLEAYTGRILNTHPALLPDDPSERRYGGPGMYGRRVHEAVLAHGDSVSGATVHLVDGDFDHGRVIRRASVDISAAHTADEVSTLVQQVEKPLAVSTLRDIVSGSLSLD